MIDVLFLSHDAIHAAPLVRAAPHMEAHGVRLTCRSVADSEDALHFAMEWRDRAILVHQTAVCEELVATRPIVILERIDGAQLAASRQWIDHPHVLGVVKGYTFRDPTIHNSTGGRVHVEMLRAAGVGAFAPLGQPQASPVSASELAKIRCGYGFGAYLQRDAFAEGQCDLDGARRYDCMFAGTVSYRGSEIESQRRTALDIVEQWGKHRGTSLAVAGKELPFDEFRRAMLDTKVCVSPWGWGEACHRDYEAMLAGAVVVKPDSSHVLSHPDVYVNGQTYVPCRPNLADLEDRIAEVVAHWPDYREMRERNRKMALLAWKPECVAEHMATTLKEILS